MSQPRFGELLIDNHLSDDSPKKMGYFVRRFDRRGGFNPGPAYQVTDKAGRFWDIREEFAVPQPTLQGPELCQSITMHLEGGLVQDVTGISAGYEVRVDDYDHSDDTQPTWDANKECHVTVYGGDGV